MTATRTDLIERLTFEERVAIIGVQAYDPALPQDWVDTFVAKTGFNPVGQVVWSYDSSLFGRPIALTAEAQQHLIDFIAEARVDLVR